MATGSAWVAAGCQDGAIVATAQDRVKAALLAPLMTWGLVKRAMQALSLTPGDESAQD